MAKAGSGASSAVEPAAAALPVAHDAGRRAPGRRRAPRRRAASRNAPAHAATTERAADATRSVSPGLEPEKDRQRDAERGGRGARWPAGCGARNSQRSRATGGDAARGGAPRRPRDQRQRPSRRARTPRTPDSALTPASSQYLIAPPAAAASRARAARARRAGARRGGSLRRRSTTGSAARCRRCSSGSSARATRPDSISSRELTGLVEERPAVLAPLQHALPVQPLHRRHHGGVGRGREGVAARRARSPRAPRAHSASSTRSSSEPNTPARPETLRRKHQG